MSAKQSKPVLAPGAILGNNYQIIELTGEGGMGVVYKAYDMRLDLQVAMRRDTEFTKSN